MLLNLEHSDFPISSQNHNHLIISNTILLQRFYKSKGTLYGILGTDFTVKLVYHNILYIWSILITQRLECYAIWKHIQHASFQK